MPGMPKFELVVWPAGAIRNVWGDAVATRVDPTNAGRSIPRAFFGERYQALLHPELLVHPRLGSLAVFGRTWGTDPIGVVPKTGEVVEARLQSDETYFVNSSLQQFTDTVRATIEALPYYEDNSSDTQVRSAVHRLTNIIRDIDRSAIRRDQFWSTFVDDVQMGDFYTERMPELWAITRG